MTGQQLYDFLREDRTPWDTEVLTVDEDGFVRRIVEAHVDEESGKIMIRLEIKA